MKRISIPLLIWALMFVGSSLASEEIKFPTAVEQSQLIELEKQHQPTIPSITSRVIDQEKMTTIPGAYARAISLIEKDLSKRGYHDAATVDLMIQEKPDVLIVSTIKRRVGYMYHGGLEYTVSRQDGQITHVGHWR